MADLLKPRAVLLGAQQRRWEISRNLDGGVSFMIEGTGTFKMAPQQAIDMGIGLLTAAGVQLEKTEARQLLDG